MVTERIIVFLQENKTVDFAFRSLGAFGADVMQYTSVLPSAPDFDQPHDRNAWVHYRIGDYPAVRSQIDNDAPRLRVVSYRCRGARRTVGHDGVHLELRRLGWLRGPSDDAVGRNGRGRAAPHRFPAHRWIALAARTVRRAGTQRHRQRVAERRLDTETIIDLFGLGPFGVPRVDTATSLAGRVASGSVRAKPPALGATIRQPSPPSPRPKPVKPAPWPGALRQPLEPVILNGGKTLAPPKDATVRKTPPKLPPQAG